jgi:hypothetical protein
VVWLTGVRQRHAFQRGRGIGWVQVEGSDRECHLCAGSIITMLHGSVDQREQVHYDSLWPLVVRGVSAGFDDKLQQQVAGGAVDFLAQIRGSLALTHAL